MCQPFLVRLLVIANGFIVRLQVQQHGFCYLKVLQEVNHMLHMSQHTCSPCVTDISMLIGNSADPGSNLTQVVFVGKVLSRDLTQQLNTAIQFLVHCRPLSISMGNAIKYLKLQVTASLP